MFLIKDSDSRPRNERGSSLIAVIGIMAVFVIISVTIVGSTMSTLSATTSARAGMQAQAAAEAGIDTNLAILALDACAAPVNSFVKPKFTVDLSYFDSDGSSTESCAGAQKIRIKALGIADDFSIAANSATNSRSVEATYRLVSTPTSVVNSAPAIYSWKVFDAVNSGVVSADLRPAIQVMYEGFKCSGGHTIDANIFVFDGSVDVSAKCVVSGTVKAPKIDTHDGDGEIVDMDTNSAAVPAWVSLDYEGVKAKLGFDVAILKPKNRNQPCDAQGVQDIIDVNGGKDILIDGRLCSHGLKMQDDEGNSTNNANGKTAWTLSNNVAIVAPGFKTIKDFTISSVSSVNLLLIQPDQASGEDGRPTCGGTGDPEFNSTTIANSVAALIYSPCEVKLTDTSWNGQIYAGKMKVVDSTLRYASVAGNGVSPALWGNEAPVVGESKTSLGDLDSIRDVD